MEWLQANWAELGVAVLAAVRLAESIAKLTPTEKDDKVVAKIASIVGYFFGVKK